MSIAGPTLDIIDAQFELFEALGKGGSSTVYRARDRETDEIVALKVIRIDEEGDEMQLRARFIEEAKTHAALQHPHTVSVYAYDGHGDTFFLAMEFVDGTPLIDIFEQEGALEPQRLAHMARQVASALTEAHAHGVIHRDLKPENILVCERNGDPNFCKVIDFGLAKRMGAQKHLTQAGVAVGSPTFMAPEQVEMRKDLDGRVDIYALGAMMYGGLCGRAPFDEGTAIDRMIDKTEGPAPPMRVKVPGLIVPSELEDIVMKCLEMDRNNRYRTMLELEDALSQFLDPEAFQTELATREVAIDRSQLGLPGQQQLPVAALLLGTGIAIALLGGGVLFAATAMLLIVLS